MDADWLDRLERRLGFLAAPDLPLFVTGMTIAVAVLRYIKPEFADILPLDSGALLRGQAWRLITFLMVPPPLGPLWLVLWILMLYSILQALEHAWGEFKLTAFLVIGVLASALGAVLAGAEFDNSYVMLAAFLAFARLLPEREVYVMFVLPVKLRWLAALAALWTALAFLTGGAALRLMIAAGLAPYLLFFGEGHWRDLRYGWRRWRQGS